MLQGIWDKQNWTKVLGCKKEFNLHIPGNQQSTEGSYPVDWWRNCTTSWLNASMKDFQWTSRLTKNRQSTDQEHRWNPSFSQLKTQLIGSVDRETVDWHYLQSTYLDQIRSSRLPKSHIVDCQPKSRLKLKTVDCPIVASRLVCPEQEEADWMKSFPSNGY